MREPAASTGKKDRRILRTRDALGDALVELIQEKSFDEITVQDVLDRAGVGRSTFYVHYRDKEDLFLSDVEDFFEKLSVLLTRRGAAARRLAPVEKFCTHLMDAREFYTALGTSGKMTDVQEMGKGFFARSIAERLQMAGVKMGKLKQEAQAHALAGSVFALIDWWVDKGMKLTPAEMDSLFHSMAWSGLTAD